MIEEQKMFLHEYKEYSKNILIPYKEEIKDYLNRWRTPYHWQKYSTNKTPNPSPIQRVTTRVKRPESVIDKILRKIEDNYADGFVKDSYLKMNDTVGARIITYFLSGLTMVHKEIIDNPDLEISVTDPPIAYLGSELLNRLGIPNIKQDYKESGYLSIHYIVRYKDSKIPPIDRPWFEIQLRTITMDIWGEIEHQLGYKPNKHTSLAVKEQFRLISEQLIQVDKHFNFLNDELIRFQTESSLSPDDTINAENLPSLLSEGEIFISQFEINGLLKLLHSRGITQIKEFRKLMTAQNLELINNIHRSHYGRHATSFELVANLANLKDVKKDDKSEKIRNWIEFLAVWKDIKPS